MSDDQATPVLEHNLWCRMCRRTGVCRARDSQRVMFAVQLLFHGTLSQRVCRDCASWFLGKVYKPDEVAHILKPSKEEADRVVWRTLWTPELLIAPNQ